MEGSSEILAALKNLQICIGGHFEATNRIMKEFVHSMDSRFGESKLEPKTSLNMNLGSLGFEVENSKGEIETAKEFDDLDVSEVAIEIVEDDELLDQVEAMVGFELETKIEAMVGFELEAKSVEVSTFEADCKIEVFGEEILKVVHAYFAYDPPLPPSLVAVIPIHTMFVVEHLGLGREYEAHVARRRTTFKPYDFKEVYVESRNLHLEDKVVLKG